MNTKATFLIMKYVLTLTILVLTSFVTSCSDHPAAVDSEELSVEANKEELDIMNKGNRPIHYFAVDREVAARINWAPGTNAETKIEAGQSKQIPFADIYGFKQSNGVILYYWPINNDKIGEIQNIVVNTE